MFEIPFQTTRHILYNRTSRSYSDCWAYKCLWSGHINPCDHVCGRSPTFHYLSAIGIETFHRHKSAHPNHTPRHSGDRWSCSWRSDQWFCCVSGNRDFNCNGCRLYAEAEAKRIWFDQGRGQEPYAWRVFSIPDSFTGMHTSIHNPRVNSDLL